MEIISEIATTSRTIIGDYPYEGQYIPLIEHYMHELKNPVTLAGCKLTKCGECAQGTYGYCLYPETLKKRGNNVKLIEKKFWKKMAEDL